MGCFAATVTSDAPGLVSVACLGIDAAENLSSDNANMANETPADVFTVVSVPDVVLVGSVSVPDDAIFLQDIAGDVGASNVAAVPDAALNDLVDVPFSGAVGSWVEMDLRAIFAAVSGPSVQHAAVFVPAITGKSAIVASDSSAAGLPSDFAVDGPVLRSDPAAGLVSLGPVVSMDSLAAVSALELLKIICSLCVTNFP